MPQVPIAVEARSCQAFLYAKHAKVLSIVTIDYFHYHSYTLILVVLVSIVVPPSHLSLLRISLQYIYLISLSLFQLP